MGTVKQEIWEVTTGGTFFVQVKDPRHPGGWTTKKVGGKGSKKITLTAEEREFNQELVSEDNAHLDPFQNGLMVRIHPKAVERGSNELSDDQLVEMLKVDDDGTFAEQLKSLTSEVVLRRLLDLAEKHTTMYRYQTIKQVVDDRYRVGKTSKVVQEIYEDDRKYADADL